MSERLPYFLLAVFLILAGLKYFGVNVLAPYYDYVTGAAAVLAGVLFLFRRS